MSVHGTRKAHGNPSLSGRAQSTSWHEGGNKMHLDVQDKSRKLHGGSVNQAATRGGKGIGGSSSAIKVLGPRVA